MPNRWLIAAAGVVMQLALGAVYGWSVTVYGGMLTAWGIAGPLILGLSVDLARSYDLAFYILAGVMLVAAIVPFLVRRPAPEPSPEASGPAPAVGRA